MFVYYKRFSSCIFISLPLGVCVCVGVCLLVKFSNGLQSTRYTFFCLVVSIASGCIYKVIATLFKYLTSPTSTIYDLVLLSLQLIDEHSAFQFLLFFLANFGEKFLEQNCVAPFRGTHLFEDNNFNCN